MPAPLDLGLVIGCFLIPTGGVWLYLVLRSLARLRKERERDRLEAEALAAEGFPPPDLPTTDSLSP